MIRLGIDIGGTSVKAVVYSKGRLLRTGQSPFYANPTPGELRNAVRVAVGPIGTLDSVGLCVPGLLDAAGTTVTFSVNIPALQGLALDRFVPEALGFSTSRPTVVYNDALATARDVYQGRQLSGRLFVLTLGTGVGAAVLDDGRPLDVEGGTPGHFGQIDVTVAGEPPVGSDGGAGGLESYIGVAALRKLYGSDVSAALAGLVGDELPISALVRALRIAHAIYRPNHIVLCGGVGIRLRDLLPVIMRRVNDRLTSIARPDATLSCGDDDFHAARGAARVLTSNCDRTALGVEDSVAAVNHRGLPTEDFPQRTSS